MKKKLLLFLGVVILNFFVFFTPVKADTSTSPNGYFPNYYNDWSNLELVYSDYQSIVSDLISYYNFNFSNNYSHYAIFVDSAPNSLIISLHAINTSDIFSLDYGNSSILNFSYSNNTSVPFAKYIINLSDNSSSFSTGFSPSDFTRLPYSFDSSFTFVNTGYNPNNYIINNSITFPSYSNLSYDISLPIYSLEIGDTFYSFLDLKSDTPISSFTEVNLSNYEYIILSLKNYDTQPFNTTIYTQGSLCFTPVYNYGMTQKQEYFNGYQVQGCTEVYSSFTPVSIYIIQSDIDYHSVYYIKQQPNVPTVLNIPTSIFNITYITSQNANSPQVVIDNRSYPVIPYSQLTDTANISSDTGYISGQTCALGDINCFEQANSVSFDDIFSKPLESLKTLWSSITSVFNVITAFITLLPPPLQTFLYISFMISIMIGILKIIL